ncbi:tumor necrosis factor a (TNF superfamily, member 2) [Megalops cyprinoides]|uniref:tumor necrosis factor a (TNF superfamily, member 2) n=1 Tax=Megalops cyprinoides TaxID=118141 RepID=UPI00186449BE|nr:tumor necrosis factor a (TNF superfamily, member 2) [Megalops cyprinoides]
MAGPHRAVDMGATVECQTVLEVEGEQGTGAPGRTSRPWRLLAGVMAVALVAAAVVLFTWHMQKQDQDHQMGGNDLKLTLRQLSRNVKAAIHLQGEYNPEFSDSAVEWRAEDGQAFYQGGLKLENNEVVIPRSGLYFVYSQASFRVNCRASAGEASGDQFVHVSHAVERHSDMYGDWKPLLSAVRSACRRVVGGADSGERFYSAVYLGAVFHLEEGDRLRTDTQRKLLPSVEGEDGKTFFGAFAL